MAEPAATEQVAFEAAESARAEGCLLAEFRMAPLLLESETVSAEAAIEALLTGLDRSPLPCGLILCGMRNHPPEVASASCAWHCAIAAMAWWHSTWPARSSAIRPPTTLARFPWPATKACRSRCTPARPTAPSACSKPAQLGATRIGHGVRLADWLGTSEGKAHLARVRELDLHMEVCPTSNVHTGAAASIDAHPIGALWRAGLSLSYHTDNPLMSCTTMTAEAAALVEHQGLTQADLLAMALQAAEHSFLPAAARDEVISHLREAVAAGLP
jgi:adenosine deaminase